MYLALDMKNSGVDHILSTVDVYLKRRQFVVSIVCLSLMFPMMAILDLTSFLNMADVISEISDNIALKRCLKRSANQLLV